jgi:hypothetical protein
MGAPLTIEQMILNHNIGVSITDAETLGGLTPNDFSKPGHKHAAADTITGIFHQDRLPKANSTAAGIVQLSDSTNSESSTIAATSKAINAVRLMVGGKADTGHKHNPADINTGTFANVLTANATDDLGQRQIRNIILGTADPASNVGTDGDIYFKYE